MKWEKHEGDHIVSSTTLGKETYIPADVHYKITKRTEILLKANGNKHLIGNFNVCGDNGFFINKSYWRLYFCGGTGNHRQIGVYYSLETAKSVAESIEEAVKQCLKESKQIFLTEVETPTEYWGEGQRDCRTRQVMPA